MSRTAGQPRPQGGESPEQALRSAETDREELPPWAPEQAGYRTGGEHRRAIPDPIHAWQRQAADLACGPVHDGLDRGGTGPTQSAQGFEPGTVVEWTDLSGDHHRGTVETELEGDRYEVVSGWNQAGYPLAVDAVEGARLTVSPWDDLNATVSDRESGIAYLLRETNRAASASRYGQTTRACAEAAWTAAVQVSKETGFRLSYEDLDDMMQLVINDDPKVQGFLADAATAQRANPRIEDPATFQPTPGPGMPERETDPPSATWFERNNVDPAMIERAAQHIYDSLGPMAALELAERAGGDRQFAVWLHLTDEHREALPPSTRAPKGTDWRQLYEAGKSPYGAVIDATERSDGHQADLVRLTEKELDSPTRRGVEL